MRVLSVFGLILLFMQGCNDNDKNRRFDEGCEMNPSTGGTCCKYCDAESQPCGDTCISLADTCHIGAGCACSASTIDECCEAADLIGDAMAGAEVYAGSCAGCHGRDGTLGVEIGGTPATDLNQSVSDMSECGLIDIILDGYENMPAQALSEQDAADCVAYLRETFP